jgi:putative transposase
MRTALRIDTRRGQLRDVPSRRAIDRNSVGETHARSNDEKVHFIEAGRVKPKQLMERRLEFCALLVDATPFQGQQMVAALGIGCDGTKTILGIWQGATENATVVGELLGDQMNRGLDFTAPRLYALDGGKALHAAVKKYAGESAPIQRCQVHKRRNRKRVC